jgi:hypothetical protein
MFVDQNLLKINFKLINDRTINFISIIEKKYKLSSFPCHVGYPVKREGSATGTIGLLSPKDKSKRINTTK